MKPSESGGIDAAVVAENVVLARRAQRITQVELAVRANVSVPSVFRAEKAESVRLSTLKKIAAGLDVGFDTLLVPKVRVAEDSKMVIHRAADSIRYAMSDRRAHLPEDHLLRYQDFDERVRLGGLGFVSGFMVPPTAIMKEGPGLVLLEIFGEVLDPFNAEFYKDGVIYVVRGQAKVKIGTEEIEISEGDWVGFPTADLVMMGPAGQKDSTNDPVVLLWIGANRRSKKARRHG